MSPGVTGSRRGIGRPAIGSAVHRPAARRPRRRERRKSNAASGRDRRARPRAADNRLTHAGRSSKFAGPDHQGRIQHSSHVKVVKQRGKRLIGGRHEASLQVDEVAVMRIPVNAHVGDPIIGPEHRHQGNSRVDQPARHQDSLTMRVAAVTITGARIFPFQVECRQRSRVGQERIRPGIMSVDGLGRIANACAPERSRGCSSRRRSTTRPVVRSSGSRNAPRLASGR